MWSSITKEVDFKDRHVLDVGCGPGDFMRLALQAGASFVSGIDKDMMMAHDASSALMTDGYGPGVNYIIYADDLDYFIQNNLGSFYAEVSMCFSCLPYLYDVDAALEWMKQRTSSVSLVECQYNGDGPYAPKNIKSDYDMRLVLERHWTTVKKIGETRLDIRPATRTIWACYHE
jgi:16S rRNA A1518/A1519 N6-dimethyltransferase RsmA/KsgA/DIM1 with predicted DNA glycosylase/AP lyase activity